MPIATSRPVLKALGDETRFGIWTWMRDEGRAVTINEIAAEFGLHANTVRPHLERLREAGLVRLDATPQGSVGRPQHRFTAVPAELDLAPTEDAWAVLARGLASLCCTKAIDADEAFVMGRDLGTALATDDAVAPLAAFESEMERLGFGPAVDADGVVFTQCPVRSLAEEHPGLVCGLHQGIAAGMLEAAGCEVTEFHDLASCGPCSMTISPAGRAVAVAAPTIAKSEPTEEFRK